MSTVVQIGDKCGIRLISDIELHIFPATQANAPEPASFAAYIMNHGVRLDLEELR